MTTKSPGEVPAGCDAMPNVIVAACSTRGAGVFFERVTAAPFEEIVRRADMGIGTL